MTWSERYDFNMGDKSFQISPDDWLNLVSGWKNEDGTITVVLNARLRPQDKIWLRPKHEKAPMNAPDYQYSVQRKKTTIDENGELEILA